MPEQQGWRYPFLGGFRKCQLLADNGTDRSVTTEQSLERPLVVLTSGKYNTPVLPRMSNVSHNRSILNIQVWQIWGEVFFWEGQCTHNFVECF